MSTDFSTLPIRYNGAEIDASWFNTLRTFLINALGIVSGEVPQAVGLTDTNQDVVGLIFDKNEFHQVDIEYWGRRKTASNEVLMHGFIYLQYMVNANAWRLVQGPVNGDDALIEFSLLEDLSGGGNIVQLRYTTLTIAGAGYTGTLKTKYKTWGAA